MTIQLHRPTYVFIGYHECGKDEACRWLENHYDARFAGSMSWHGAPIAAPLLGVSVETLRGPERHKYSEELYQLYNKVREKDPYALLAPAFSAGNLLNGFRSPEEIANAKKLGPIRPLFIWIDRDVPVDSTMREFGDKPWRYCDMRLSNEGTLDEFYGVLDTFARAVGMTPLIHPL